MSIRYPLLAVGLLVATQASAADWPTFRGPNRDGICQETGLLKEWPKDGPKKLWTVKNLGLGFGTPSIADGKIFGIGTRDNKDGVWALNEADGKELWFTPFADLPGRPYQRQNNGPNSTPTYHNGKLYTVSGDGTLACLNAADGKLVWSKNYGKDFGADGLPSWGYAESVLADGDVIICIPGSSEAAVAALKADTGEVVWKTALGELGRGYGYSSAIKATIAGTPMYVTLLGDSSGVVGLDVKSGKVLWQYKGTAATGSTAQVPIPIIKDDLVWVSTSYGGGSALLKIVPSGTGTFTVKELKTYNKPELNNHHGGMVLVDGYIYFGHDQNKGHPVCVEFKTGEIAWGPVQKSGGIEGGNGSAAVLYADGRLYFRYQNGVMVLIEPSPEDLKVVSSFKLPPADQPRYSQSWPHPVIASGKMYIRDQNALYCYDVKADSN